MKAKLFFLGAFLIFMAGFQIKSQTCTAGFTYTITTAGQVNFTITPTGTAIIGNTYYNWYYGDSTGAINGGGGPRHTYQYNGPYNAQLNISDISRAVYCIDPIILVISNTQNPPCPKPAFAYTEG